jgi:hypothetical protein
MATARSFAPSEGQPHFKIYPLSIEQHSVKLREPRKAFCNQASRESVLVAWVMTKGTVKSQKDVLQPQGPNLNLGSTS